MNIAVLGSGNGGCAVAGECALHGHDVRIFDFKQFPDNIRAINDTGGVQCTGKVKGFGPITYSGHNIEEAVKGADLIYVVGPSYATASFAQAYKPEMKSGQRVIVCPGTNGGAMVFKKELGLD